MTPAGLSFACGAGSFAIWAALALVALRLPGRRGPVVRLAGLALLVHPGATAAAVLFTDAPPYWYGAALSWCGFIFVLFASCAVYKSVSLAILAELARQPDHSVPLDEISDRHVLADFLGRIRIRVEAGLVARSGDRFHLTDAGRRLARRVAAVQGLFGVARSGLYGREPTNTSSGAGGRV
jgi:hypothetical protein